MQERTSFHSLIQTLLGLSVLGSVEHAQASVTRVDGSRSFLR
jgi:hypothetical protein